MQSDRIPRRSPSSGQLFDAARRRETNRPLEVGIHANGLARLSPIQRTALEVLTAKGRPGAPRLWLTAGEIPGWFDADRCRRVEIASRPDSGPFSVRGRTYDAISSDPGEELHGAISNAEAMHYLAGSRRETSTQFELLIQLSGLRSVGCDVVVTGDDRLLAIREHNLASDMNLMTPEEALILVGVWARTTHVAFIAGNWGTNVGSYFRALATGLVPNLRTLVRSLDPNGSNRGFNYAGSMFDRLVASVRVIDRMVATWHCEVHGDTLDEILDDFDRAVLNTWGIYDNLALLLGHWFGLTSDSRRWSLTDRLWRHELRLHGPTPAAICDLIARELPYLQATKSIRDQLAHRVRLTPVTVVDERRKLADYAALITDDAAAQLERAVGTSATRRGQWGVHEFVGPITETVAVSAAEPNDVTRVTIARGALVDPLVFSLRATTQVALIVDACATALISAGPVVPAPTTDPQSPSGLTVRGSQLAIRSSAFLGLADWAILQT